MKLRNANGLGHTRTLMFIAFASVTLSLFATGCAIVPCPKPVARFHSNPYLRRSAPFIATWSSHAPALQSSIAALSSADVRGVALNATLPMHPTNPHASKAS